MIKIAVIGLGERIAQVLPHLIADPRFRLMGYADPAPTGLKLLAAAGHDPSRAFASPEALIEGTRPDLLMIGSPNHLHLEHLEVALAGAPLVFCEKPIVRTEEESFAAARLLADPAAAGRLMVGFVLRSSPVVRRVSQFLAEGRLGRLVSMEMNENLHPEHGAFLMKDWRRFKKWGGSFLLDKCCHDFDVYGLFAGARAARIASFGGRQIFVPENAREMAQRAYPDGRAAYSSWDGRWAADTRVFDSEADVRDVQTAIVEYDNGVQLAFHCNSHAGFHQRRWHLVGTRASLAVDLYKGQMVLGDPIGRGKAEKIDMREEAGFDAHTSGDPAMARDIVARVIDGTPYPVTPLDALIAGLTVMGVDRAADEGRVVDMDPVWRRLDEAGSRGLA